MLRVMLFGAACAVLAAIFIFAGAALGLALPNVLYGIAAGAVLGLVRLQSPLGRAGAFLVGYAFGVIYFVLSATVLPSTPAGVTVATIVVILVCTLISALTRDRMPLWAMFLGAMTFVGAYWASYASSPWLLPTQSVQLATAVLLTVAAGFLVTLLVEVRELRGDVSEQNPMVPEQGPPPLAGVSSPTTGPAAAPASSEH